MRELWHNQLPGIIYEELLLFSYMKGTLLEQEVSSKQINEARIFLEIFCNFAAA